MEKVFYLKNNNRSLPSSTLSSMGRLNRRLLCSMTSCKNIKRPSVRRVSGPNVLSVDGVTPAGRLWSGRRSCSPAECAPSCSSASCCPGDPATPGSLTAPHRRGHRWRGSYGDTETRSGRPHGKKNEASDRASRLSITKRLLLEGISSMPESKGSTDKNKWNHKRIKNKYKWKQSYLAESIQTPARSVSTWAETVYL